jgi:hypothetical protein
MWPDIRLGVVVGGIAIVLGSVAALLTSTTRTPVGTAHAMVAHRAQAGGEHEVAPIDRAASSRRRPPPDGVRVTSRASRSAHMG